MVLIIENGTNVANANSYVSISEIRNYCEGRAIDLPIENQKIEALAILAMDYLELQDFKGERTYSDQVLEFPRNNIYIRGNLQAANVVPTEIKLAQIELVLQQLQGFNLFPTVTRDDYVTYKSIEGAISKAWDKNAPVLVKFSKVQKLLNSYLLSSFNTGSFSVYRG